MAKLLAFTDLDIDVENINVQRYSKYEVNSYLEIVDMSAENLDASRSLIVLDHLEVEAQSNRDLKNIFLQNPEIASELLNDPDAKNFPLLSFPKSDTHMDETRIISNIEMVCRDGMPVEHAMSVALLAEYGAVGNKATDFAHSKTFKEMQSFLSKIFPDGPSFLNKNVAEAGVTALNFGVAVNATSDGVSVGGITAPKGVNIEHSLTMIENATTRRAQPKPLDLDAHA